MATKPTIAVVICTRNRPRSLLETLQSIWTQTRPPDELVVIDDGELDAETRTKISTEAANRGIHFTCQKTTRPGLTPGRNLAARLARSDVLLFLDDDVTCRPDCIERFMALFADPLVAGVTATIDEPKLEGSRSAQLYQFGYRVAAWWRVAPRRKPPIPPPRILERPWVAVRARWLSGAAMALRRNLVLENPFDENLVEYALGEDREMGYRLGSRNWLLESRLAKVVHRRDGTQRTEGRRLGYMTVHNYLYILSKTCLLGIGDWLMISWSLFVVALMHVVWSLGPGWREHIASLLGMAEGFAASLKGKKKGTTHPGQSILHSPRHESDILTSTRKIPSIDAASQPTRRVLFVTNRLEPGGAELMLVALVKRLPGLNVRPHILCLKDGGPLAADCRAHGVPVLEGMLRHKADAAVIPRIKNIISEFAIDVVVVAHSGGDRMFWTTLAARLSGTPVIVWSHWFPLPNQHHFERANRALYRMVDTFVAIGERQRLALIRHEHVPAGRITVIPNAIELERFLNSTVTREEARRRLRLTDDQVAIAIVANLRNEKRHDVFIRAAQSLATQNPRLRFLIIGDGPNRDAVQAAAAASGLDHETLRLVGPRDDIPELLAGIDISCLCSDQECFSVTMLEAAAARVPFIGPNSGCMPEFLEHLETGLLVEPANPVQLADAIQLLVSDASLRTRLADNAQRRVLANYGVDSMGRAFADLIFATHQTSRSCHSPSATPPRKPSGPERTLASALGCP